MHFKNWRGENILEKGRACTERIMEMLSESESGGLDESDENENEGLDESEVNENESKSDENDDEE